MFETEFIDPAINLEWQQNKKYNDKAKIKKVSQSIDRNFVNQLVEFSKSQTTLTEHTQVMDTLEIVSPTGVLFGAVDKTLAI